MVLFHVLVVQFSGGTILTLKSSSDSCPFCARNEKVEILHQTTDAYLIRTLDPNGKVIPGCYFINPKPHVDQIFGLPLTFMEQLLYLMTRIPEVIDGHHYNLSLNIGRKAGQRVNHLHVWIIDREGEEGEASFELGMAALIREYNKLAKERKEITFKDVVSFFLRPVRRFFKS